jgi:hypothetical protein
MDLLHGLMEDKITKRYVTHLLNLIKRKFVRIYASRRPKDDLDLSGMRFTFHFSR